MQGLGVDEPAHVGLLQPLGAVLDHARRAEATALLAAPQVGRVAGAQVDRRVVVQAQEVDGLADELQVAVGDQRGGRQHLGPGVARITAVPQRLEEQAIQLGVNRAAGLLQAIGRAGARHLAPQDPHGIEVEADADGLPGGQQLAQHPGGQAVAEQQVMGGGGGRGGVTQAGGVLAVPVAVADHDLGLVQGDPAVHPVAERLGDDRGVIGEALGGVAGGPAALVLELLGQVPVVQGGRRRDAVLGQLVEQARGSSPGPSGWGRRGRRAGPGARRWRSGRS